MLKEQFYREVDKLYQSIKSNRKEVIEQAALCMAESVQNGGCIHLFDTAHILDSEIIDRAGGLVLMRRFRYELDTESSAKKRVMDKKDTSLEGFAELALSQSSVLPGDVMVIGSVSGTSCNVIDLAAACRKMRVKVIAVTSKEYSATLGSKHSCGKHLFELADITIDNCAPYDDAMVGVEGIEAACFPASGLAASYLMWAVNAELIERLLSMGIVPGVLKSKNYLPNIEYNEGLYQDYQKSGN